MITEILRCTSCLTYTLQLLCPTCGVSCVSPKPAKWSVEDKYGVYRRQYKARYG